MKINTDKTKIVHFRTPSVNSSNYVFTCGNSNIDMINMYKYLGLILTEHLDYHITAKMVAQSASLPWEIYT